MINYDLFVDLRQTSSPMKKLTAQEEEAMLSIWQLQGGFVKEILENIGDDSIPYTTLASTIKNLERKGYVKAKRYANAKRYEPLVSKEEYKAKYIHSFVGDFFKNSYKEMVSFFTKEEKITAEELEEIVNMIRKGNLK